MFKHEDQLEDMRQLWKAMDGMKFPPACENFPEAFFPDQNASGFMSMSNMAKKMCDNCPVKAMCAEYGIRWEVEGIWGGISPRERQNLRAKMRRQGLFVPEAS
jgi:WhiB family transcriptional regulator, redox-sensing transcriptional regulator